MQEKHCNGKEELLCLIMDSVKDGLKEKEEKEQIQLQKNKEIMNQLKILLIPKMNLTQIMKISIKH